MTFQGDWRTSFPGVNAANRLIECADDYLDRMEDEPDDVVDEIRDQGWAEGGHEGVPQPDLDEIRRLFERAADQIEAGDFQGAEGTLEDLVAFCMPED